MPYRMILHYLGIEIFINFFLYWKHSYNKINNVENKKLVTLNYKLCKRNITLRKWHINTSPHSIPQIQFCKDIDATKIYPARNFSLEKQTKLIYINIYTTGYYSEHDWHWNIAQNIYILS